MAAPDMAAAAAAAANAPAAAATGHRRNRSAVLRSLIASSRSHRRSRTEGAALPAASFQQPPPLLPRDHPHSQVRPSTQHDSSSHFFFSPPSPRKSNDARCTSPSKKNLHKKSLSSVSLRSLAKRVDDKPKDKKSTDSARSAPNDDDADKPKRPKSSTNLAAMFGKARSRDRSPTKETRDKENTEPPRPGRIPPATPIWAEFSSHQGTAATKASLNDQRRSIDEGSSRFSPAKQRNFLDYQQPAARPASKPRPKSMFAASSSTTSLLETFSRKRSSERMPLSDTQGNEGRQKDASPTKSRPARPTLSRSSTDSATKDFSVKPMAPEPPPSPKKASRVMAAVAAFNGKAKQAETAHAPTVKPDPKVIDAEFEEVLVSVCLPQSSWPCADPLTGIEKHSYTPTCSDANTEARGQG